MKVFLIQIVFLIGLFAHPVLAQNQGFKCPWDEVDCPGKCGRFFDSNGDGFCDYGRVSKVIKKDTATKKDTVAAKPVTNTNQVQVSKQNGNTVTEKPESDSMKEDNTIPAEQNTANTKPVKARSYSLLFICLLCFGLYGLTSFMHDLKMFRKFVHRRIWNILLLLTFLTTAILGIILVVQINYNLDSTLIRDYLYWHVQFGIAMAAISMIHIVWHWKYFYRIFSKKSKNDCVS